MLLDTAPTSFLSTAAATPGISTLSLHDALPISRPKRPHAGSAVHRPPPPYPSGKDQRAPPPIQKKRPCRRERWRSEEHTSELQSRGHLVCRLLLEKKTLDLANLAADDARPQRVT